MIETYSRSVQLVKESYAVLKKDKEILLFPIISAIINGLIFLFFFLYMYVPAKRTGKIQLDYQFYIMAAVFYFLTYFAIIFLNTALISCAHMRLNGKDPTVMDGIRNALKHSRRIIVWGLISATVGALLSAISKRTNIGGKIATSMAGIAWNLVTFFIIPVMIFENLGVIDAIKRSAQLFKKTWGENLLGQFSIAAFFSILFFIGFIVTITLGESGLEYFGIGFLILFVVMLYIFSGALNGIFVAALYIYAAKGKVPSAFSPELIKGAFKPDPAPLKSLFKSQKKPKKPSVKSS